MSLNSIFLSFRPKRKQTLARFSFDNNTNYKGHGSIRFNSLNQAYKQVENYIDNNKNKNQEQYINLYKSLQTDLFGYHNESMSPRDKELYSVYQINDNQCDNPKKLEAIKNNLNNNKNTQNCFYNQCYEYFKNESEPNRKKLGIVEESLKYMLMGLQNKDADIMFEHDEKDVNKKYTNEELLKFEQNHQYVFSLCDDFKTALLRLSNPLEQNSENPLESVIKSREEDVNDRNNKMSTNYKVMYDNLTTLSQKWQKR